MSKNKMPKMKGFKWYIAGGALIGAAIGWPLLNNSSIGSAIGIGIGVAMWQAQVVVRSRREKAIQDADSPTESSDNE